MTVVTRTSKASPLSAADHDHNLRTAAPGHLAPFGALGDGTADDRQAIINGLAAASGELRHIRFWGNHRVGVAVELMNDVVISAKAQSLTQKARVFPAGHFPIFRRSWDGNTGSAASYLSRLIIDDVMLHGRNDGLYETDGTSAAYSTEPLILIEGGGAYLEMHRAAIFRCVVGLAIKQQFNLGRIRDVKVNGVLDKAFHLIGPRDFLFDGCAFEGTKWGVYAEPAWSSGALGTQKSAQRVAIRGAYTEAADFYLDCAMPEITGCWFDKTSIQIGKNAVHPIIRDNHTQGESTLLLPPKLSQDVVHYARNCRNPRSLMPFRIPALPTRSDVSGPTGYVVGDGLDYLVVTQIKPDTNAATQDAVIEFRRDSTVLSRDGGKVTAVSGQQDQSGLRNDIALTTYGVIPNTGATMDAALSGATGCQQRTVFIQSLMKNGALADRSTTNWVLVGSPVIRSDGAYTNIAGGGGGDEFRYNRLMHVPRDTEALVMLARVRAGSSGANISLTAPPESSESNWAPGRIAGFFDNGDGTLDDLWVQYVYAKGETAFGKTRLRIRRALGMAAGWNLSLRWVAVAPLVAEGRSKTYEGNWSFGPSSIAAGTSTTTTIMADGDNSNDLKQANLGDRVQVFPPVDLRGIIPSAHVSATGQITVRLTNPTGAEIALPGGAWRWEVMKQ